MKKIEKWASDFNNGILIIGTLLHELSHVLMAVLLYPLGSKVVGVKIVIGRSSAESFVFEGWVCTTSKRIVCQFLISVAPLIFYFTVAIWILFTNYFLIGIMVWFWHSMKLSEGDKKTIRHVLKRGERFDYLQGRDAGAVLNASLNKNIIQSIPTIKP